VNNQMTKRAAIKVRPTHRTESSQTFRQSKDHAYNRRKIKDRKKEEPSVRAGGFSAESIPSRKASMVVGSSDWILTNVYQARS